MNEVLGSLKWIVGAIMVFVGLHLGVEAYKSGESVLTSLGVAGFGAVFLIIAGLLRAAPSDGGISQEELERYRTSEDDSDEGDGWRD